MRMIFIFIDSLLRTLGFIFTAICSYEYMREYINKGNKFELFDFIVIVLIIYFFVRVVIDWRR